MLNARPLMIAALLSLSACQERTAEDASARTVVDRGGVARAAVAPDGTVLWVTRWDGRLVFFASTGASWQMQRTRRSGKTHNTTTEYHAVPTSAEVDAGSRTWSE
ncbi:hypothetical protein [Rhizorhabdus sp.]|uniref:hypothetical protein n=1 Tax=Rhizorhabdus sp. TaxID=1968843 RepID=UPI0035B05F22